MLSPSSLSCLSVLSPLPFPVKGLFIHPSSWGSTPESQLPPTTLLTFTLDTSGPELDSQRTCTGAMVFLWVGSTPCILWSWPSQEPLDPSGPHLPVKLHLHHSNLSCFFKHASCQDSYFSTLLFSLKCLHPSPLANIRPMLCNLLRVTSAVLLYPSPTSQNPRATLSPALARERLQRALSAGTREMHLWSLLPLLVEGPGHGLAATCRLAPGPPSMGKECPASGEWGRGSMTCGNAQACGLKTEAKSQRSEPHRPLPAGLLWETLSLLSLSHQPVPMQRQGAGMPVPPRVWLTPPRGPSFWTLPQARKLQGQLSQQNPPPGILHKSSFNFSSKATHLPEEKAQGQQ